MEKTIKQINENTTCWYAVYTATRAEKKAKKQLERGGFESYLPLQGVVRIWNNRKQKVMVPVIPGFIFVCLPEGEIAKIIGLKGVSMLLKEERQYVAISGEQLESLRSMVEKPSGFIEFVSEQHEGALQIEGLGTILLKTDK